METALSWAWLLKRAWSYGAFPQVTASLTPHLVPRLGGRTMWTREAHRDPYCMTIHCVGGWIWSRWETPTPASLSLSLPPSLSLSSSPSPLFTDWGALDIQSTQVISLCRALRTGLPIKDKSTEVCLCELVCVRVCRTMAEWRPGVCAREEGWVLPQSRMSTWQKCCPFCCGSIVLCGGHFWQTQQHRWK